jgi:D-glycero-alpha-D-manno-heptose-7-phosphate kinase
VKVRAKAPLRLGLAGGGTDVSPYSDTYGGCVLNATLDLYAYTTIEPLEGEAVEFAAEDLNRRVRLPLQGHYRLEGELILHRAIYNRMVERYNGGRPLALRVTTYADAPPGSGLGTSSTMVVSMISAYRELLRLPLGEYDIARLAYEIERKDCALSGGKQDQYAATFGGFNFMEFSSGDKVVINPLRIRDHIVNELHARLLLYFTGQSRSSAQIIEEQIQAVKQGGVQSLESMHELKRIAVEMKERLLTNDIDGVSRLFRQSWEAKKKMASGISNAAIDEAARRALEAGADAVKVSGAGGGGFMMIFSDPTRRIRVQRALEGDGGGFVKFNFTSMGAQSWSL